MRPSDVLFQLFSFLIPPALISTVYLYLYPAVHGCSFPPAKRAEAACYIPGSERDGVAQQVAPFRLLAFGDPQLEGDSSLPDPNTPFFPSLAAFEDGGLSTIPSIVVNIVTHDAPEIFHGYRKKLDLLGNDYYLAHIYWLVHWWSDPTHMVVLGDLLGSQWIDNAEFVRRSERFWERVFKGAERVPDKITGVSGRPEVLGSASENWKKRMITVAGNHDIGYAGDIDDQRIDRFEKAFGPVNWEVSFQLPDASGVVPQSGFMQAFKQPPELRLVMLNSMNLDTPAYNNELHEQTLDFLSSSLISPVKPPRDEDATVLLTHIPLHRPEGVCVDSPFFDYFAKNEGGGIKEQNHLSEESSQTILESLAGIHTKGNAIILNGHDHVGCDVHHVGTNASDSDVSWEVMRNHQNAQRQSKQSNELDIREITVRSMMGSYGGNVGMLSAWFDEASKQWKFEYEACFFGVQHIWWGVHVLDLIVVGLGIGGIAAALLEEWSDSRVGQDDANKNVR